jgi:hypothetical protein
MHAILGARASLAALAVSALFVPPAFAGHPRLSLQQMLKQADVGFHGKVVSMREEAVPEKGMAFTHVTLRVLDVIFNRTPEPMGDLIELTFAGGTVDGKIVKVSDVPEFTLDEEVVALVLHDGKRYASPVVGGRQGLFRVLRDETSGALYPVTEGRRGIDHVAKGEVVTTAKVTTVRGGAVTYADASPNPEIAKAPPPQRTPGSPAGTARETRIEEPRPERLMGLTEFLGALKEQYQQLPAGAR